MVKYLSIERKVNIPNNRLSSNGTERSICLATEKSIYLATERSIYMYQCLAKVSLTLVQHTLDTFFTEFFVF